jgi:glycine/D-amino acid oxidase-like deaminating enzyme
VRVGVIGAGHVGLVTCVSLASVGHRVVGTDSEDKPGHFDYLFATPDLAGLCVDLRLDNDPSIWDLSDHCPLIAEFDLSTDTVDRPDRLWDKPSFLREVEQTHGTELANVAESLMLWAEAQRLRAEFTEGAEGWCWVYSYEGDGINTFVIRTRGDVVPQFQSLRAPYDDAARREELRRRLNDIPGISIAEDEITGYPAISLSALRDDTNRERFLTTFEEIVSETRRTLD